MKASAFRKPAFVAMAAFGFSLFGSISTTYAETSLAMSVSIPCLLYTSPSPRDS